MTDGRALVTKLVAKLAARVGNRNSRTETYVDVCYRPCSAGSTKAETRFAQPRQPSLRGDFELNALTYWIGMAGTTAFAITGVLAVAPKGIDFFGATVLGIITAIGGGTIRDIILGVPVFWAADLAYIWVALAASLATFAANSLFTRKEIYSLMLYLDGLGASLFAIAATDKVWALDFGRPLAPVILGIITAIGGGLIRDVLAGRQTLLMTREIYAIPISFGCALYVALLAFAPEYQSLGAATAIVLIFALRAAAIHWNLTVPDRLASKPKEG